jgi:hypothetical protein
MKGLRSTSVSPQPTFVKFSDNICLDIIDLRLTSGQTVESAGGHGRNDRSPRHCEQRGIASGAALQAARHCEQRGEAAIFGRSGAAD